MMERIISFCKKNKWYIAAGLLLLLCGVLLYVLVSHTHCEHDDWYRRYPFFLGGRAESLGDVFKAAWTHFHIDNARLVCAAWEFFYCSYLDSKTWFDVANSIVFMIFVLSSVYLMGHKDKVEDKSKSFWWRVALFVVPFWFLCPTPGETLCWMCGSVDYLWMTTASMLFLCLWYRIKEKQKDVSKLAWVGYFILSVYLGISNNFVVIGIGGALFVYYLFHIKEFRGLEALMVIGFAIGAMIVTFGPGNWARLEWEDDYQPAVLFTTEYNHSGSISIGTIISAIKSLFATYKTTWLLLGGIGVLAIKDRKSVIPFIKENQVLLLAWFWSAIAFSFVFKADTRGLFFTETIALILFVKIVLNYFYKEKLLWGILIVLCIGFGMDYTKAYSAVKESYAVNEELMQQMVDNNGEICYDNYMSKHRYALSVVYAYPWRYVGQEVKYGWKLVVHPRIYCEVMPDDKICTQENAINAFAFRDGENVVIKIPKAKMLTRELCCSIDYMVPQSFVRNIAKKLNRYKYEHHITRVFAEPTCENDEYYWYFIKQWTSEGATITNVGILYE